MLRLVSLRKDWFPIGYHVSGQLPSLSATLVVPLVEEAANLGRLDVSKGLSQ